MDSRRPSRYGCLECSEDAEAVLGERLPAAAEERYFDHIRGCSRCWRAHRVLQRLYAGPDVPSERSSTSLNREFAGILRGLAEAREERSRASRATHLGASTAVVALATTACVLALMLIPGQGGDLFDRTPWVIAFQDPDTVYGGIDHPAMVYGRIVGGQGRVLDSRGETLADHIFPIATRLETDAAESMQLQLVGKILTNVGPSSELTWRSAGSGEVELGLERGLVAFRYDRLPGDPTLKIETPTATVQIRGTVFTVEVDDAGHTTVSVLRGKVEVQGPDKRVLADVRAGYRFDVAARSFSDVGRAEVQVALPLSLGPSGVEELSGGRIPSSWTVPGLPVNPQYRTLDNLIEITDKPRRQGRVARVDRSAKSALAPNDDGQALLEMLVRDAENTRAEAIRSSLARCKELYLSPDSRYRSSQCLRTFIDEHDGDTRAAEAHLLIGIQRMDYAGDHQAAMDEFRKFIERAPDHPEAELARYRLWLAATEKGDIQEAKRLGRAYLHSHPRGRYVGQIIKRFRDLASELGG
ncbi:MAG: FecR domain-containing protein, partial [Myxococcales bacterium]|nr:FecR domain-containing protein [Myxococcales bacterium]